MQDNLLKKEMKASKSQSTPKAHATTGLQNQAVVIIAGMPRSGKAVVAQALGRAGLYLGDNLRAPSRFNPEGYFEEEDIIRFHEELLKLNNAAWDLPSSLKRLKAPEEYEDKARELVAGIFVGHAAWGWKDPRTTLFLDLWDRVLPQACWIFVVRRPAEVVTAMLARGDHTQYTWNPVKRVLLALQVWVNFNRRILQFARTYPQRCLLVLAPDDFDRDAQHLVSEIIRTQWQIQLRPLDFEKIFVPALLTKKLPFWIQSLTRLCRPASALFEELVRLHKMPRQNLSCVEASVAAPPAQAGKERRPVRNRIVCIIAPREFAYSETFVRDHARYLPATVKLLYGGSRFATTTCLQQATGLQLLDLLLNRGEFPNRTADGRRLISLAARGVDLLLRNVLKLERQLLAEWALQRYLRRERVEAVLAEFGQTGAQVMTACTAVRIPLIVYFHGSDAFSQKWLDQYGASYRKLFQVASGLIAVSKAMVEQLVALGAPGEKVLYNPCGVDTDLFKDANPASAPPSLLAVGRFVEKKAPDLTLLAFRKALDRCPAARLVMIGDGELMEVCHQLTKALKMEHAVSFTGVRSHLEIVDAMRQARAFVQHSVRTLDGDSEGTPVSILEAGASGLPVISTRHGGIQDVVVDGETGFLVDEGDIDGMAHRMVELVQSPALAAALGQCARERVHKHYSMEKSINTAMEVIEWSIRSQRC